MIGGLLVVAAVVGAILWIMLGDRRRRRHGSARKTTVLPDDVRGVTDVPRPCHRRCGRRRRSRSPRSPAWDPDGTNGSENDAQAPLALADGSGATSWSTECYSSQYMGGKSGVGLIVTLVGRVGRAACDVESVNAPYALQVFASADATPPTALAGWGEPIDDKAFADVPGRHRDRRCRRRRATC